MHNLSSGVECGINYRRVIKENVLVKKRKREKAVTRVENEKNKVCTWKACRAVFNRYDSKNNSSRKCSPGKVLSGQISYCVIF